MRLFVAVALALIGCGSSPAAPVERCQGFDVEIVPRANDGGSVDLAALAAGIESMVDGAACETVLDLRVVCATADTLHACGLSSAPEAQALGERIAAYLQQAWPALVGDGNPVLDRCACESF